MASAIDIYNQLDKVNSMASQLGVRPEVVHAMIQQESGGRPDAVSSKGAFGLMQLMPGTAKDLGVDPTDPDQNLRGGVTYFKQMLDKFGGDEKLALAAYNAGPSAVQKAGGMVPNFPETQNYVSKVSAAAGAPKSAIDTFNALQPTNKPAVSRDVTELSPDDEQQFQQWAQQNHIPDVDHPDSHYDYRGFWQQTQGAPHVEGEHFPDTFKQHGHPTFSVESKYSTGPGDGGSWQGDRFVSAQAAKTLADPNRKPASAEQFVEQQPEQSLGRTLSNAWENLNPIAGVKSLASAVMHPVNTYQSMVDASSGEFQKAKAEWEKGHYSEAIGHGAAGALPVIGPAAAQAGEEIGKGDVAGGVGHGLGLVGSIVAPELLPKAVKKIGTAVTDVTTTPLAERIINSNVKPNTTLVKRNPGVNIPRVILDEGLKAGEKGADQARAITQRLSDEVTALADRDTATGKTYSIQKFVDNLNELEQKYLKDPLGADNVRIIRDAKQELLDHPAYGKDVTNTRMVKKQVQSPHPTAVDAQGNPIMQTKTVMVPETYTTRALNDLSASDINTAKKAVYEQNPRAYGEQKGAQVEGHKAVGRGAKSILDDNVAGIQDINKRQSGVIVARKALTDMGIREAKKYPIGLLDLLASGGATTALAAGHPIGAAGVLATLLLKHPSTAFPIAKTLYRGGKAAVTTATAGAAAGAAGAVVNNALRPVTKQEAQQRYQAYLAAIEQQ